MPVAPADAIPGSKAFVAHQNNSLSQKRKTSAAVVVPLVFYTMMPIGILYNDAHWYFIQ
jgi:hypothetical protein